MSGQFLGHFRLYLIDSTKVISSKVAKFGSMDIVELHGDILQPGGQLETPGLVFILSTEHTNKCSESVSIVRKIRGL